MNSKYVGLDSSKSAAMASKCSPHLCQRLVSWNRLDSSAANLIPATARFGNPQLMNEAVLCWIKALDQTVGKQGPCFAGQCQSFFRNLLDFHARNRIGVTAFEQLEFS
jgi:hypothetical protein